LGIPGIRRFPLGLLSGLVSAFLYGKPARSYPHRDYEKKLSKSKLKIIIIYRIISNQLSHNSYCSKENSEKSDVRRFNGSKNEYMWIY
jgi:hypothetical protein